MLAFFREMLRSRFFKIWIAIVLVLILCAIAFSLWAHDAIDAAYKASLAGKPTTSFINHNERPVEYYHQRADMVFWQYIFWGVPLTLLSWYVLIRGILALIRISRETSFFPAIETCKFKNDTLIALLCYLMLTAIYFSPIFGHFSTHLIGPPEDNMGGLWSQWWAVRQVLHGGASLTYTRYLFFPEGVSLYYNGWSFYSQAVAAVARLVCGPISAYNFVVLHTYPIAGLGTFLLVRKLTKNSFAALLAGFIFAFSPIHFMRSLHHVNQSSLQFVPFFILYFIQAIRSGGTKNIILAGIFLLLNTLCDWNFLIMGGYFILFGYLYFMLKQRRWWFGSYVGKSAIIVAIGVAPLLFWLIPMVKLGLQYSGAEAGGRNTYVADLMSLFVPHTEHLLHGVGIIQKANQSYTGNAWECVGYLGLGAIALVVINFRLLVKTASRYWLGFIAFLTMALGPQIHLLGKSLPVGFPYTFIAFIPFLRNARAPSRFMIYLYIFWAILIVLAAVALWSRQRTRSKRLAVGVAISLLLALDFLSIDKASTRIPLPGELSEYVAVEHPTAFLNLPRGYINTRMYMAQQTRLGIPMVSGQTTRKLGKELIDSLDFKDLGRQHQQLAAAGVSNVIIHKYSLAQLSEREDVPAIDTSQYLAHYRLISSSDSLIILGVD